MKTIKKIKQKNISSSFLLFIGWTLLYSVIVSFDTSYNDRKAAKPGNLNPVLFHILRSINTSEIIYELNVDENGDLNLKESLKIYWKNYATDSSIQSLNYIQKKYAYGIDVKLIDVEKKIFCFNFVSYKNKTLYLLKSPVDQTYRAFCEVSHKFVVLNKIFIQIDQGTFWNPKIRFIEITGKDPEKNEIISEKIIP